jgi:hypothetical protein
MVPQGDFECGRLGKILQRPHDWRICGRHLEGEAMPGGVEASMVKEDFVCREAVGNFPIPIGVGNGFRRPRPPNRACGSPAHGSPVGGFLIEIGTLTHGPQ